MMRTDEIISSNLVMITLSRMQISFEEDYKLIRDAHRLFLRLKSPHRHRPLHNNIDLLEHKINKFLEYDFDPDPDIDDLKGKVRNILIQLDNIRKEIP